MRVNLWKIAALALVILGIQACGGDEPIPTPPKTAEEIATEALTGSGTQTWTVSDGGKVMKGSEDVTTQYADFELSLASSSSKTYISQNSNELFDASGTWTYAGSNFDKITLNGSKPAANREMSFTQSGNSLKLVFSIPTPGARISAVAGDYVFDLVKK